jgi:hypothetical protein
MNPDLLKKLRLTASLRALVLNAPLGYLDNLSAAAHTAPDGAGPYAFVQVFTKDSAEFFDLIPIAARAVTFDGLLWLSYPKKTGRIVSNLSRDIVWELMKVTVPELRPVTQIALDDTWSALRFRPTAKVGS